jgi:hypothetical protein
VVRFLVIVGIAAAGSGTAHALVAQPQPPVAPSLPTAEQQWREQAQVVPPALPSDELQDRDRPEQLRGRVLSVDAGNRRIGLETSTGPRDLRVPDDAILMVNGREVSSMLDLPREGAWQISVRGYGDGPTIELRSTDQSSAPSLALPPPRPNEQLGP